jgi:hypothetical protein
VTRASSRFAFEFSPQILPMIQTPGHGSFPAGHAAESFMLATVLSALMEAKQPDRNDRLARLAARISVNRVIAGMHFPVDLAAGLVLGLAVARYFVALAKGEQAKLMAYKFVGEKYETREFPWGPSSPWQHRATRKAVPCAGCGAKPSRNGKPDRATETRHSQSMEVQ